MISPEVLRGFGCFAGASDPTLGRIAMFSEKENHTGGVILFQDGEPAEKLYLIAKGEIDLAYRLAGGEVRVVDTLVGGELLMWSALVEPYKSTAMAVTRGQVELVAVEAAQLRALCGEDHDLGYTLLDTLTKLLAGRLTNARVQLAAAG